MNILLASAHPYIPQISGGAQSSTHELAVELIRRGHKVAILAGLTGDGLLGLKSKMQLKLLPRRYALDEVLGYPVFRAWFSWEVAAEVAAIVNADVAVLQSGYPVKLGHALADVPVRRFIYLRNVELEDLGGDLRQLENVSYIANSRFTEKRFGDLYGIRAEMVHPLVRRESYQTNSARRNVTFINPHHHKGVDIALAVAERCPEIPFCFVEGWTLGVEEKKELNRRVAAARNITLRPRTRDMKSIYGEAKIVLAPSRWEEAFGRVAAEAHFSGIPVIGSNRGGLPEAVGPGGLLVDVDAPVEDWVAATKKLWHDETLYAEKSAAAQAYSMRPEIDREKQLDCLLSIFDGNGNL